MLKSPYRLALSLSTFALSLVSASAATLDMWVNQTGDTSHAPVILVLNKYSVNLTVYFQTSGVGGTSQIGGMLAWDKTTNSAIGASATASGNGLSYHAGSFAYAAPYASANFLNGLAGGSGSTSNSTARYGYFADTFVVSGSMLSAEGTPTPYYSLTLDISKTANGDYPVTIWVDPSTSTGPFSSYVFDANGNRTKANGYTAIIRVKNKILAPPPL